MKRIICSNDLPPSQAGLAAALRRAFEAPSGDASCEFDALLRKLG
ncbi:hypothetical protein [Sphingomonas sp.]|nr:hypothetical protein [Sphingomonas sp.]